MDQAWTCSSFTGVAFRTSPSSTPTRKKFFPTPQGMPVVTGVGHDWHAAANGAGRDGLQFPFLGGPSMGSVVGEKLTRLIEGGSEGKRRKANLPLVIQFQPAVGAPHVRRHVQPDAEWPKLAPPLLITRSKKLPYISVLTPSERPAGVMASYASVGDLIIAEPHAHDRICGTARDQGHDTG